MSTIRSYWKPISIRLRKVCHIQASIVWQNLSAVGWFYIYSPQPKPKARESGVRFPGQKLHHNLNSDSEKECELVVRVSCAFLRHFPLLPTGSFRKPLVVRYLGWYPSSCSPHVIFYRTDRTSSLTVQPPLRLNHFSLSTVSYARTHDHEFDRSSSSSEVSRLSHVKW